MMQPTYGARPCIGGTSFSVWAPEAKRVEVLVSAPPQFATASTFEMAKGADGVFRVDAPGVSPGFLYQYRVDGKGPYPDPASRFQPKGVHEASRIEDGRHYKWSDDAWKGAPPLEQLVIYELHVGTFTPQGTFVAAIDKLRHLKDLGVNAIELLPIADFPGSRNWGYDGVALYAPARCYGEPDDLRRLVDAAHALGLAVFLDVVYNHAGPDGNYLGAFSPYYFTTKHTTPWGAAFNIDRKIDPVHAPHVRRFFIDNALCWLEDYHFDGLRLDATHAIVDDSEPHFLRELATACHAARPGHRILLFAEDDRNEVKLLRPPPAGYGIDCAWADDFHHQVRVHLTGQREGYFRDFTGTAADIARTINQGWYYTGQRRLSRNEPRGTDPSALGSLAHFCTCVQNHDQVGNRAFGDRLSHTVDADAYKAASALLLLAPEVPLLFMGQEWAASSPWAYFTDHHAELGRLVTEGRRKEFGSFAAFSDPCARDRIPDPQSPSTFASSKLNWSEIDAQPHRPVLRWYQALLRLRATNQVFHSADRSLCEAKAIGEHTIALLRLPPVYLPAAPALLLLVNLRGSSTVHVNDSISAGLPVSSVPEVVLSSADIEFRLAKGPHPRPNVDFVKRVVEFDGPSAVVLHMHHKG